MNSDVALRLLTKGARTRERKIIPPIQLTAASTWSQTRKTIILPADPSANPHSSCQFVSNAREDGLVTEVRLVEQYQLNDLIRKDSMNERDRLVGLAIVAES
ncbi:MAG: hypothetical protein H7Y39_18485 [Nitrospiraceae bacterium]|nr:hypothetical protein [Nitrospiraceae bacterium]